MGIFWNLGPISRLKRGYFNLKDSLCNDSLELYEFEYTDLPIFFPVIYITDMEIEFVSSSGLNLRPRTPSSLKHQLDATRGGGRNLTIPYVESKWMFKVR